jgi:hypothetical protein
VQKLTPSALGIWAERAGSCKLQAVISTAERLR